MMKHIAPLAIGALVGGVAVYWWIKRTCPCQQQQQPGPVTPATMARAPELELGDVGEFDDIDQPAVVLAGDLPRPSSFNTYQGASSSSSSAASSGCTTCGA